MLTDSVSMKPSHHPEGRSPGSSLHLPEVRRSLRSPSGRSGERWTDSTHLSCQSSSLILLRMKAVITIRQCLQISQRVPLFL